jgi:hypothetical protein
MPEEPESALPQKVKVSILGLEEENKGGYPGFRHSLGVLE